MALLISRCLRKKNRPIEGNEWMTLRMFRRSANTDILHYIRSSNGRCIAMDCVALCGCMLLIDR